jgi:hypothetical protein
VLFPAANCLRSFGRLRRESSKLGLSSDLCRLLAQSLQHLGGGYNLPHMPLRMVGDMNQRAPN